ncbi:MAG TPA: TonB family protein [Saprospiraceae bacterium]|nr:TonB family protein [Saprospiraceae bacterium]HNT21756.1 TonB family protein [Saprospiraceae bacterium]
MITLVLQSSLCWLFFMLIYRFFLQKETFFRFNRYYLLGTLLLGLWIPLVRLFWEQSGGSEIPVYLGFQGSAQVLDLHLAEAGNPDSPDWLGILVKVYWGGVLICFLNLMRELAGILNWIRKYPKQRYPHYTLVQTDFEHLPFSFLHWVFISDKVKFRQKELRDILFHETSHVSGWHSLDVLLAEGIAALAWFSPMVYWYKRSIRNTHEYLADALVTRSENKDHYGRLLIDHAQRRLQIALANHFIYSQLKNRIHMLMKSESKPIRAWKYALVLPIMFFLGVLFAYKSEALPAGYDGPMGDRMFSWSDTIHTQVDEMPVFPGCAHLTDLKERSNCSMQKLMDYLVKNVQYPLAAKAKNVQGKALVSFVVNTDGSISDIELKESPGSGTGEEALRVVRRMNQLQENWIPGKENHKTVRVRMTLPILFKLQDEKIRDYPEQALYFLNGDRASLDEIKNIFPDQILSMNVVKGETALEKYGEEGRQGVIEILTKPKYVVNGVETTKEEADKIPADQIESVNVVKYGKKEAGVVDIKTKKDYSIEKGQDGTMDAFPLHKIEKGNAREIFKTVEDLPRFPGCEHLTDKAARDQCAFQLMLEYIYKNIKYPKTAKEQGIEGRVVASFVVEPDGRLSDIKIVKEVGSGCGDEVLRVVKSMDSMDQKWIPGKQNGQAVPVQYNLPVEFKLSKEPVPVKEPAAVTAAPGLRGNTEFKLIPNPARGEVEIRWDRRGQVRIEIFDLNGKSLHQSNHPDFNGFHKIDVRRFSPGTYIARVIQGTESQEQKLLIGQ